MQGRERTGFIGQQKGMPPVIDYNTIRPHDSHEAAMAKMEYWIAKQIGERLVNQYPGREWGVNVDARNGVVVITCPSVSLTKGYYIHCRRTDTVPLIARALKAAGEILERYSQSRQRIIDPVALEALPRGARDELIVANTTDTKPEPMSKG